VCCEILKRKHRLTTVSCRVARVSTKCLGGGEDFEEHALSTEIALVNKLFMLVGFSLRSIFCLPGRGRNGPDSRAIYLMLLAGTLLPRCSNDITYGALIRLSNPRGGSTSVLFHQVGDDIRTNHLRGRTLLRLRAGRLPPSPLHWVTGFCQLIRRGSKLLDILRRN